MLVSYIEGTVAYYGPQSSRNNLHFTWKFGIGYGESKFILFWVTITVVTFSLENATWSVWQSYSPEVKHVLS